MIAPSNNKKCSGAKSKCGSAKTSPQSHYQRQLFFVAVFCTVAVICVVAWLCPRHGSGSRDVKDNLQNKNGLIAETSPHGNSEASHVGDNLPEPAEEQPRKPTRKELRDIANGRGSFTPPAYTSQVTTVTREMKLFAHPLEHWLARFATIEPGEELIGEPEYIFNERFRSKIAAALVDKIVIDDDDTEEERELKTIVNDAKKELARYISEGDDPCEIMIATFNEYRNIGLYKKELEEAIKQTVKEDEPTEEECEDILEAANKMLAERGCGKIKMPSIFKRRIKILRQKGATK